jgi:hypothetical protein
MREPSANMMRFQIPAVDRTCDDDTGVGSWTNVCGRLFHIGHRKLHFGPMWRSNIPLQKVLRLLENLLEFQRVALAGTLPFLLCYLTMDYKSFVCVVGGQLGNPMPLF